MSQLHGYNEKGKRKQCIVICNGPSIATLQKHKTNIDFNEYDIIAVNRWNRIFNILDIRDPDYVVIGKNSMKDNLMNMKYKPHIKYRGIDPLGTNLKKKYNINCDYKQLTFGTHNMKIKTKIKTKVKTNEEKSENENEEEENENENEEKEIEVVQPINFIGSLWWSGIYAIQLALKLGYEHISVYGFTCTNDKDYVDVVGRAPIPRKNFIGVRWFFHHLKQYGLLDRITFYEDKQTHPIRDILFY